MTVPRSEIQTLTPGAIWTGWKIDMSGIGGSILYLSPSLNSKGEDVIWSGGESSPKTYMRFPIQASGFEAKIEGQLPRPTVSVAALDGTIGGLIATLDDLVGAVVTRRRVLVKYLDAANWVSGNPTADPTAGFQDDVWIIDQKTSETVDVVAFQLSAASDFQGMKIPRRVIQTSTCPSAYKNGDGTGMCPYTGALTTCAHTLADCRNHFPTGPLPFGGFPGALSLMN